MSQENMPTLANCSFDKHREIVIIFLESSISTLSKMIHLFNFPFIFTFVYFICFWIVAPEMTQNLTFSVTTGSEKSQLCRVVALKKRCFSLADIQTDVLSLSHMHKTTFSIDQQLHRWHFVICCPCVNEVLVLQVADVMEDCLVHAFLHQSPNCVVTWILEFYPFNLYTELVRTLSSWWTP